MTREMSIIVWPLLGVLAHLAGNLGQGRLKAHGVTQVQVAAPLPVSSV
jgi:hypothetical protein